jgi:SAM-dependent methyltransferase
MFCRGRGIEIGALHHPMPIFEGTKVRYVDRMSVPELRRQYTELAAEPLVEVDIIDDGESLKSLPDGLEDFVIASQFLEHCQNPIRALVNMLRVVRNQGFIMLTIPDKRFTVDRLRPITTNEHLLEECMHGTENTRRDHFVEYARLCGGPKSETEVQAEVEYLMNMDYSIHYHVWDSDAFIKFLIFTKERLQLPFELYATIRNRDELIAVLQKTLPEVKA